MNYIHVLCGDWLVGGSRCPLTHNSCSDAAPFRPISLNKDKKPVRELK